MPEVAKRIESDLGKATTRLLSSSSGEDRAVGEAFWQVQSAWRDSLTAIGNREGSQAGTLLRDADASWRTFLPVDRAGSMAVGSRRQRAPAASRRASCAAPSRPQTRRSTTTRRGR